MGFNISGKSLWDLSGLQMNGSDWKINAIRGLKLVEIGLGIV